MKNNHSLALIAAYYLSKYDNVAYKNLGYGSRNDAHRQIGVILKVKHTTVKNMRDEFDPIHDNQRVGWYQHPLTSSRVKVVESFQNLAEEELRDVVLEILSSPDLHAIPDFSFLVESIANTDNKPSSPFIVRGPTGRKAEDYFIEYYKENMLPKPGLLIDQRDHGVGYDFEIQSGDQYFFVEVKGLADKTGGIVFTSKEWDVAQKKKEDYFLVIVRQVSSHPSVQIIQNPSLLQARKNVFTTVQVKWNIYETALPKP